MWRLGLVLVCAAGLLATAAKAQVTDPSIGARPLETALERPFVLRLWRSNRAFLEFTFLDLDQEVKALAAEAPTNDIFDIDVFVAFVDQFASPSGIEGHMLEPVFRRELAKAGPGENIRMFSVPLTRNSDGAQKGLHVIAVETSTTRQLSDLCLAIAIYDTARWFFSSSLRDGVQAAMERGSACHRTGWSSVEDALTPDAQ